MNLSAISPTELLRPVQVCPWYCNLDDTSEKMISKCKEEINKLKERYDNYIRIIFEEDEYRYVYKVDFIRIKKLFVNNSFDNFCELSKNVLYYDMFENFWGNGNVSFHARELLKKVFVDRTIRKNIPPDNKYHYYGGLLKDKYGKFLSDYDIKDNEMYRFSEDGYVLYEIDLIDYCFDESNTFDLIPFCRDEVYRGNYEKDYEFFKSVNLLLDKS